MVDFHPSMQTAYCISALQVWTTNELTRAALREGADRVIDTLCNMLAGKLKAYTVAPGKCGQK
eukprot:IDg2843t1